jgi:hypothetical protein
LCGDSTDAATVARVMETERAAMLFTSPPYGNQRAYTTGGVMDWDALMQGVFQHLDAALRPDGQALVNLGLIHRENEWQPYWEGWLEWMRARGWRRFGLYTWDQGPGLPGDWNGRLRCARPGKCLAFRQAGEERSAPDDEAGRVGGACHPQQQQAARYGAGLLWRFGHDDDRGRAHWAARGAAGD